MSDLDEIFQTQSLSQTSNYSGVYETGVSYQKFDFVYNTGDGLFYYAREDMAYGGGSYISGNNRLSIIPDGPYTNDGKSHYILDTYNQVSSLGATFEAGQIVVLEGSTGDNDGYYRVLSVQEDVAALNNDTTLTGAAINVIGLSASDEIENLELASANQLKLSEVNLSPEESDALWAKDLFFFDADYGSTVSFKANNYKYEYGNGYYILQPKNVNSLTFEVDLKFKNRTNREANAISHFLENHQGQHEGDKSSPNLQYSQGISGFRWDGNATFHPYDSNETQTKTFYSSEWNRSLNFENSNDLTVKLRNLDTSLLRKSEQLFVNKADTYSSTAFYEKNDVAFFQDNHKYYYWHSDSSASNKPPAQIQGTWTRENGAFTDTNTGYWTRDFFWKPSIGLSVSQKPRMQEFMLGAGYTQIYSDGINESLLNLDLQFNNRNDEEAYAILHFLEHHYGAIPFMFSPPAPYEGEKNFVCQEWSHTYNYKNNHSISARFEQYPFNYTAQQYDNQTAPPPQQPAEAAFITPFVMSEENVGEAIPASTILKKRMYIKNLGDFPLNINQITVSSLGGRSFSKLAGGAGVITGDLTRDDHIYQLPTNQNLPFSLGGKFIKLSKVYTDGSEGGQAFIVVVDNGDGYVPDGTGAGNVYFQNNKGQIKKGNESYVDSSYFINTIFLSNNASTTIAGKDEGYIDIVSTPDNNRSLAASANRNLLTSAAINLSTTNPGIHYGNIQISSNGIYSPINGLIKIYVT
jgi:phage-related protein